MRTIALLSMLALVTSLRADINAVQGAILGGVGGAAIGAAVDRHHGQGALIGGGVGAVAGALIGDANEQRENSTVYVEPPPPSVVYVTPPPTVVYAEPVPATVVVQQAPEMVAAPAAPMVVEPVATPAPTLITTQPSAAPAPDTSPIQQGVATLTNMGTDNYNIGVSSTTGFYAVRSSDAAPTIFPAHGYEQKTPPAPVVIVWSCKSETDPTPEGVITELDVYKSNLQAIDVRGLSGLQVLKCNENDLKSVDLSNCHYLKEVNFGDNANLQYMNAGSCPSLHKIDLYGTPLARH